MSGVDWYLEQIDRGETKMERKVEEGIRKLIDGGWSPEGKMIGIERDADYRVLSGCEARCVRFTFFARMSGDEIVPPVSGLPYGFVHIESVHFPKGTVVALIKREDFRNAWEAEKFMLLGTVSLRYRDRGYPTYELNRLFPLIEFVVDQSESIEEIQSFYG